MEPYRFRPSDRTAATLEAFLEGCRAEPVLAADQLQRGYFEPWLRDAGWPEVAEAAAQIRQRELDPAVSLAAFLEAALTRAGDSNGCEHGPEEHLPATLTEAGAAAHPDEEPARAPVLPLAEAAEQTGAAGAGPRRQATPRARRERPRATARGEPPRQRPRRHGPASRPADVVAGGSAPAAAGAQPGPTGDVVGRRRFRVEFVAERVIGAADLRDALRQAEALGATDIIAVVRED
jgi:hypothetical protein